MSPAPYAVTDTKVELFGPMLTSAGDKWGNAASKWGDSGTVWWGDIWQDIGCQVLAFRAAWGVDDPALGVLGQSASGEFDITTYDPAHNLDPSSPSLQYGPMMTPRTPMRIRTATSKTVRTGYLDQVAYSYHDHQGRLSGYDGIALLAAVETPSTFTAGPNHLYALAAAVVAACQLPLTVDTIGASSDPIVSYREKYENVNAWEIIRDAAVDALHLAYIDPSGVLRFAPYGTLGSTTLNLGDGGIDLAELTVNRGDRGIVNQVGDDAGGLLWNQASMAKYGPRAYTAAGRREPSVRDWSAAIIADRADAAMEYVPGEIHPATSGELASIIDARPMDPVRVRLTTPADAIDVTGRLVGGAFEGEGHEAWRCSVRMYQPGSAWSFVPGNSHTGVAGDQWHGGTIKDAFCILENASMAHPGKSSGAGTAGTIVVGGSSTPGAGATYAKAHALVYYRIDLWDWFSVRWFDSAYLHLWVVPQAYGAGTPQTFRISRLLEDWDEGYVPWPADVTSPVIWPGPAGGDFIDVPIGVSVGSPAWMDYDVTSLILPSVPRNLGGQGLPFYGLLITMIDDTKDALVYIDSKESGSTTYLAINYWF